jgi:microcystin-dependent protein
MEPMLGMIYMFSGNFAPARYELCQGQILQIRENTALFSIMGTTYGGDGVNTFALPKLSGPAPGLNYVIAVQGIYPARA